jgi:hypothetical protein
LAIAALFRGAEALHAYSFQITFRHVDGHFRSSPRGCDIPHWNAESRRAEMQIGYRSIAPGLAEMR